jgi:hypothetical protein
MSKYFSQRQPDCAGKRCPNKGTFQLTIIYLNRKGWFCNSCKQELTKDGLVTENIESGPSNETQIPIRTEPTPNDQAQARRLIIGNQKTILQTS